MWAVLVVGDSYVVSLSGTPFHQGTGTGWFSRPDAMMIGKCARRWKCTQTSRLLMVTSAPTIAAPDGSVTAPVISPYV